MHRKEPWIIGNPCRGLLSIDFLTIRSYIYEYVVVAVAVLLLTFHGITHRPWSQDIPGTPILIGAEDSLRRKTKKNRRQYIPGTHNARMYLGQK